MRRHLLDLEADRNDHKLYRTLHHVPVMQIKQATAQLAADNSTAELCMLHKWVIAVAQMPGNHSLSRHATCSSYIQY